MYFDYYSLILVLPALIFSLWAQFKVQSTFAKYSKVRARVTGADACRAIQAQNGLSLAVEQTAGNLTDHYDPRTRTIRLSQTVYGEASVAAVGVAAHETGHALQHEEGYAPMRLRSSIVSITQFATNASFLIFIIGILIGSLSDNYLVSYLGLFGFFIIFFFQLVTLPVEFNASRRALRALEDGGILSDEELRGARKVLTAAALTYVAAMFMALAQFLRMFMLLSRNRGRRR